MRQKLTIVLKIRKANKLSIDTIPYQTNHNFNLMIIDPDKLTNFEDVDYISNEINAIDKCETDYIYFMTTNDYLRANFVSVITQYCKKYPTDIIWFNDINNPIKLPFKHNFSMNDCYPILLCNNDICNINGIYNKVYNVKYLKKNYLGISGNDINYRNFNYNTLIYTNSMFFINRNIVYHEPFNDYYRNENNINIGISVNRKMLEAYKIANYSLINHRNDIKEMLLLEDKKLREQISKCNNENNK